MADGPPSVHPARLDDPELAQRVRSEFLEMPGLRLTAAQAARLWALDYSSSERLLEHLAESGFLGRDRHGAYRRPD